MIRVHIDIHLHNRGEIKIEKNEAVQLYDDLPL